MAADKFHYHEAMDRLNLAISLIEDWLIDHPAIEENDAVEALIAQASDSLASAYQRIGQISFEKFPEAE